MATRRTGTAERWVWLAMGASFLVALTGIVCLLRIPLLPVHTDGFWGHVWAFRARALFYVSPFAIGLVLMVWAERRFQTGFQQDQWTEAELENVDALLKSKALLLASLLMVALWVGIMLLQQSMRGSVAWYALLMPTLTAQRIRHLIAPKTQSAGLLPWGTVGRLRSEHWGERGA